MDFINRKIIYQPKNDYRGLDYNWEYGYKMKTGCEKEDSNRQFLFFHANSNCASDMIDLTGVFGDGDYYFHEYYGYGKDIGKIISKNKILVRAGEALRSLTNYHKDIYLVGSSLGTGVISELIKENKDIKIKGIILITPFTKLSDLANDKFPCFGSLLMGSNNYDCINNLKYYKGKVVIIAGLKDKITSPEHSLTLHSSIKNSKLLFFNGGHNDAFLLMFQWKDDLLRFLFD